MESENSETRDDYQEDVYSEYSMTQDWTNKSNVEANQRLSDNLCWYCVNSVSVANRALWGYCNRRGIIDIHHNENYMEIAPSVIKIQQSYRCKSIRKLPKFSESAFNNLAFLAMMSEMIFEKKVVTEFWPTYVDICISVCDWIEDEEAAKNIRNLKNIMYNECKTLPVTISQERFRPVHFNSDIYHCSGFHLRIGNEIVGSPKSYFKIVVLGFCNSGKSTIIKNLVHNSGDIEESTLGKLTKAKTKNPNYDAEVLTVFLDSTVKSETADNYVEILTSSGQQNLTPNKTCPLKADCAVLVVPAIVGEFEAGSFKIGRILESISFNKGIKQLIVVVNKMDLTEPPYDETRFETIKKIVAKQIEANGYNPDTVPFIPISGCYGLNICEVYSPNLLCYKAWHSGYYSDNICEAANLSWYRGWHKEHDRGKFEGKTLLDALDASYACLGLSQDESNDSTHSTESSDNESF